MAWDARTHVDEPESVLCDVDRAAGAHVVDDPGLASTDEDEGLSMRLAGRWRTVPFDQVVAMVHSKGGSIDLYRADRLMLELAPAALRGGRRLAERLTEVVPASVQAHVVGG